MKRLKKYGKGLLILFLIASIMSNIYLVVRQTSTQAGNGKNIESDNLFKNESTPLSALESDSFKNVYGVHIIQWVDTIRAAMPVPSYVNQEIQNTMGDETREAFSQAPNSMFDYDDYSYAVPYISDELFSTYITLYYNGDEFHPDDHIYNYVCFTYDLRTGKILSLDDILDIDAFTGLLSIEGTLHSPEDHIDKNTLPQKTIDHYYGYIVDALKQCCDPQIKTYMQPTFYLTQDRIWFYDILPGRAFPVHTQLYVKLEDIRHILKISI